ncbi:MAG: hypothetical protein SCK70_09555 [bacterium]|nr:hypothetical protein [bacterium]
MKRSTKKILVALWIASVVFTVQSEHNSAKASPLSDNNTATRASVSQHLDFSSSNLPIIVIDTFGQDIPDEPKITAHMGIIYNGENVRNAITDPFNNYDGMIGIETRGSPIF